MPRKSATDQAATLDTIRTQAFQLFGQYGYDGVSIGNIAKASGLSKGAMYWHFQGKDALYIDCLRRLHGYFDQHIFDVVQAEPDPIRRMQLYFHGIANLVQDDALRAGIAGYWQRSNRADLKEVDAVQRAFEARTSGIMEETLRLAVEQEVLDLADDLVDMARAMIAVMEAIVLPLQAHTTTEVYQTLGVLARTMMRAYTRQPAMVELFRKL